MKRFTAILCLGLLLASLLVSCTPPEETKPAGDPAPISSGAASTPAAASTTAPSSSQGAPSTSKQPPATQGRPGSPVIELPRVEF